MLKWLSKNRFQRVYRELLGSSFPWPPSSAVPPALGLLSYGVGVGGGGELFKASGEDSSAHACLLGLTVSNVSPLLVLAFTRRQMVVYEPLCSVFFGVSSCFNLCYYSITFHVS